MSTNNSEVARLRAQIDAEKAAMHSALSDFAEGSARHDFITARMENLGRIYEEYSEVDKETVLSLIIQSLDEAPQQRRRLS